MTLAAPLPAETTRRGLIARALRFGAFVALVHVGAVAFTIAITGEAWSARTLSLLALFGATVLPGALMAFALADPLMRRLPRIIAGHWSRGLVMLALLAAVTAGLPALSFVFGFHTITVDIAEIEPGGDAVWKRILWAHLSALYLYLTSAQKYLVLAAPLATLAGAWRFARGRD